MKATFAVAAVTVFVGFVSITEALRVKCPPRNGVLVTLLPHSKNCSNFIMCNDGIPYLMHCQQGLHFNPVEKVCDWPSHAKCRANTTKPSTTEAVNATEETTTEIVTPTTPDVPETTTTEQRTTEGTTVRPTEAPETTTEKEATEPTTDATPTTTEEDDWWWWGNLMNRRN
ncbi:probable chitinase 10 [Colletes gigas]|uniref:probable chitinase 10 n=1 Tax=Colletes gigas TaxID=935657 RepID=UPI001C9BA2B9|nr:probable chitinase 10 [Colletes gigas]